MSTRPTLPEGAVDVTEELLSGKLPIIPLVDKPAYKQEKPFSLPEGAVDVTDDLLSGKLSVIPEPEQFSSKAESELPEGAVDVTKELLSGKLNVVPSSDQQEDAIPTGLGARALAAVGKTLEPFTVEEQKFSPEVYAKAKEELDKVGGATKVGSAVSAALDTILFGNLAEAKAKLDSLLFGADYKERKEVYEAMQQIRRDENVLSYFAGSLAGYVGGATGGLKLAQGLSKAAKTAVAATTPTVQAAAIAAEEAKEGKEAEAALKSVALDGILTGLTFGAGRALKGRRVPGPKPDPQQVKTVGQEIAELSDKLLPEARVEVQALSPEELEAQLIGYKIRDKALPSQQAPSGEELEALAKITANKNAIKQKVAPLGDELFRDGIFKLMDVQYVANYADRAYGQDLGPAVNRLANQMSKISHETVAAKTEAQKVLQEVLGKSPAENMQKIVAEIDAANAKLRQGEEATLSPQARKVVDFFEKQRQTVNRLWKERGGVDDIIAPLQAGDTRLFYIPHRTLAQGEIDEALAREVYKLTGKPINKLTVSDAADLLKSPKAESLIQSAYYLSGRPSLSGPELLQVLKDPKNSVNFDNPFKLPTAAFRRQFDEVPELIRQKDLGRLMSQWIDGTYANVMLRKDLESLAQKSKIIKEVDPTLAKYFDNLVNDISGNRRGVDGVVESAFDKWKANMYRRAGESGKMAARLYRAAGDVPEVMAASVMNMYPYYLGLRVDGVLRNLSQPFMQTLPSTMAPGSKKYMGSLFSESLKDTYVDAAKAVTKKTTAGQPLKPGEDLMGWEAALNRLKEKGWMPAAPTPTAYDWLSKGVQSGSSAMKKFNKVNTRLTEAAMYLYSQSDVVNRVMTMKVGDKLGSRMLQGDKEALNILGHMPPGYRRQVQAALKAGENPQDIVTDWLINSTQFQYNRAAMSEFGRSMGRLGSMFTKWPTAVFGDFVDAANAAKYGDMSKGQASRYLGLKYGAPLLALYALDKGFYEELSKENPQVREVLGRNLTSWASATSLMPLADMSIIQPPALETAKSLYQTGTLAAKNIAEGDIDKLIFETIPKSKGMALVPGATWFKFFNERIPRLLGEDRSVLEGR